MRIPILPATLSLLAFLSPAAVIARITGISAPRIIKPGEPFQISVLTQDYIQAVYDVAIVFGISPGRAYPNSLGSVISSEYLGPSKSNTVDTLNFTVMMDESTTKGKAILTASLMSLYGALHSPMLDSFNVTVDLGDATSAETVASGP
ncbi:uncharacterized protein BP5553_07712 [Venustampulla echinocandica]|uniref:Secreted protein NIS1 n=1 Tax=Venustampulla echinocandica TaxID=2656787 RepID=A0A370THB3_9HELO|nr:uncharacterized protein BP5553_07712 [Venustampulla echinocandica]RDL34584.1 hypothetical protein BP5553_07712 [Venustampulla echinocandica]